MFDKYEIEGKLKNPVVLKMWGGGGEVRSWKSVSKLKR